MKWMSAAKHLPPTGVPVVVETYYGYFLATYVTSESITIEALHQDYYDEEYAKDFAEEGWYARCRYGRSVHCWLSCKVLRWALVRDDDPSLRWFDVNIRQPVALEAVLVRTERKNYYCAVYVPPLSVTLDDFIRFDANIERQRDKWEFFGRERPSFVKCGWHTPVYCENGKRTSIEMHETVLSWAWFPKVSAKNELEPNGVTP